MKFRSRGAGATEAFGATLSGALRPGDVVVLAGDLGAGKTTLTRGIVRGLGLADRVTSPTFALVHHYDDGPVAVVHVDAWRLDGAAALEDLGVEDVLDGAVITVVEWGERVSSALPAERCTIELHLGASNDERVVEITPAGRTWQARRDAVERAAATSLDAGG